MKWAIIAISVAALVGLFFFLMPPRTATAPRTATSSESKSEKFPIHNIMTISSPAFEDNQTIPKKYTCDSENINPPLIISGVPETAKSLALVMDDPDAPTQVWVHWTIWNIDPKTTLIPEHSVPSGSVQGITGFNESGYGGPCPHAGTHRYFFKLYALDLILNLPSSAKKSDLETAIKGHILDQAELMGTYKKN